MYTYRLGTGFGLNTINERLFILCVFYVDVVDEHIFDYF